MITSYHIVPKINGELLAVTTADLVRELMNAIFLKEVSVEHINQQTLVIAIGGDGTMLQAMRIAAIPDAVVVGVNLGRVGFLTDVQPTDLATLQRTVISFINGGQFCKIEHRTILQHVDSSIEKLDLACNEFSVAHTESDSMIWYKLYIDGVSAGTHRANSVLISTATGSTAYALSVGGALMYPSANAIQIVPIAPMSLTSRPIIVDAGSEIVIEAWGGRLALRADGNKILNLPSWNRHTFKFQQHGTVRVLHQHTWNFFEVLSQKLGWTKE